jgi:hypothetical protein
VRRKTPSWETDAQGCLQAVDHTREFADEDDMRASTLGLEGGDLEMGAGGGGALGGAPSLSTASAGAQEEGAGAGADLDRDSDRDRGEQELGQLRAAAGGEQQFPVPVPAQPGVKRGGESAGLLVKRALQCVGGGERESRESGAQ